MSTSNRFLVKRRIVELIRNHRALAGVQVEYGYPGDTIEPEAVWVAQVDGSISIPTLKAGRKHRDDEFTVTICFQAGAAGRTMAEQEERVVAMFGALEDVVANDPTLNGLTDVIAAGAQFKVEGPQSFITQEGAAAFLTAHLDCHSRYT